MPYAAHENTNQERNETMSLQINEVAPDFRPHLLDLVQGTTACSSTVFYGLLAWANLPTDNLSTRTRRQSTQGGCYDRFSAS